MYLFNDFFKFIGKCFLELYHMKPMFSKLFYIRSKY